MGLIFAWIVMPFKLPASLRSYFIHARKDIAEKETSHGKTDGLYFVISSTLILIPVVDSIAWLPALIVLMALIFLVCYLIIIKRFGNQLPDRDTITN
ncbi:MAG: hypothetical protein NUV76_07485 [Candidatus Kuenenia sp.]|nr:hypothetical protein [Candidatus Kuenenia sp.]